MFILEYDQDQEFLILGICLIKLIILNFNLFVDIIIINLAIP